MTRQANNYHRTIDIYVMMDHAEFEDDQELDKHVLDLQGRYCGF